MFEQYPIKLEDLTGQTFPYSRVLQAKWQGKEEGERHKSYNDLYKFLRACNIFQKVKNGKLKREEAEKYIYAFVAVLREKYPEEFPTGDGWWTKRARLRYELTEGREEFSQVVEDETVFRERKKGS